MGKRHPGQKLDRVGVLNAPRRGKIYAPISNPHSDWPSLHHLAKRSMDEVRPVIRSRSTPASRQGEVSVSQTGGPHICKKRISFDVMHPPRDISTSKAIKANVAAVVSVQVPL